jgi:hypothetical protein
LARPRHGPELSDCVLERAGIARSVRDENGARRLPKPRVGDETVDTLEEMRELSLDLGRIGEDCLRLPRRSSLVGQTKEEPTEIPYEGLRPSNQANQRGDL